MIGIAKESRHDLGLRQRVECTGNYAWWGRGEEGTIVGFGHLGSYFVKFDNGGQDLVAGCDVKSVN